MRDDMTPILKLQDEMRRWLKFKGVTSLLEQLNKDHLLLYRNPEFKILRKTINAIEKLKLKYPELRTPETNSKVHANLTQLYKLFGGHFDGDLLRLQKILLTFDDSTSS